MLADDHGARSRRPHTPFFITAHREPMPSDDALMVPAKGLAVVGALGVLGGFAAGFSFAERLYATEAQKGSVRKLASLAAVAIVATAAAGALGVLRATRA